MVFELVFDGGNGASLDCEAYGSFRLLSVSDLLRVETIKRVTFGKGYTNNEAEYMTLITALEYMRTHYWIQDMTIHIAGDSELVRNQIGLYETVGIIRHNSNNPMDWTLHKEWLDVWRVKKAHLLPLRDKARELLQQFKSFTYEHIPRKEVVKVLGH